MNEPLPRDARCWAVSLRPAVVGDAAWRSRLLARLHPRVQRHLERQPDCRRFVLQDELFAIELCHQSGPLGAGSHLQLHYVPPPNGEHPGNTQETERLVRTILPCPALDALEAQLVGVTPIIDEVLVHLACRWTDRLDQWSLQTGTPVPGPLREHFRQSAALFLFSGDPGTGKTSVARVVAHRYCRDTGQQGTLLELPTAKARGNGLVGDLGRQITAALEQAADAAQYGPTFLLIDEGDAIAPTRNGENSHHEDKAGTAALIQSLDALVDRRLAVFLTTNLSGTIDPAVLRRGREFSFARPDRQSRTALVSRWMPTAHANAIRPAVNATDGMTAADLVRALADAHLRAIQQGTAAEPKQVLAYLKAAPATRRF